MSSFDQFSEPNPSGSPLEKIKIARRSPAPKDFSTYLQREGIDPDMAQRIGRAFQQWDSERHFENLEFLIDMEMWANTHTHPGSGGVGEVTLPPGIWSYDYPTIGPPARHGHGSAFTSKGLHVFGGYDGSAYLSDHWLFDGTDWIGLAPLPDLSGVGWFGYTHSSSTIYVYGGDGSTNSGTTLRFYDVDSDTWTTVVPGLPDRQSWPALTLIGSFLYLTGGFGSGTTQGTHQSYDITTGTITSLTSLPVNARMASPGIPIDGIIYYAFREQFVGIGPKTLWLYDIASDTWTFDDGLSGAATYAVKGPSGQLLVGVNHEPTYIYDIAATTFTPTESLVSGYSAVYTSVTSDTIRDRVHLTCGTPTPADVMRTYQF